MANIIKNIITGLFAEAAVIAVILVICGNHLYVVRSGSMEPAIKTGDLAVISGKTVYREITEGDIICFTAVTGTPVIHRAVCVSENGITTKGDANNSADAAMVVQDNFIGRLMFHVPFAGYAAGFLGSAGGKILLTAMFAAVVFMWVFKKPGTKVLACFLAAVLMVNSVPAFSAYAAGNITETAGETAEEETQGDMLAVPGESEAETEKLPDVSEEEPECDEEENGGGYADPETSADSMAGTGNDTDEVSDTGSISENEESGKTDTEIADEDGAAQDGETQDDESMTEEGDPADEDGAAGLSEETSDTESGENGTDPEETGVYDQTEAADAGTGVLDQVSETEEETGDEDLIKESEEAAEEETISETVRKAASVSLKAAEVYTVTVRYRVNGGTIQTDSSAKVQYAAGTDIGINNTLVYKSSDYGASWSQLKTLVTTEDTSADLENIGTIGITMPGYRVTQAAAYNTLADQTGLVLCQNAGETNPVTTKRLNGGTEITSDMTVDVYVNWQTTLILDANGGSVWGDPSVTAIDAGTIFYGSTYYLINRYSSDYPQTDSSYIQTVPNFYREGYVFDGWNTVSSGDSYFGGSDNMDTQYGRGGRTALKRLAGDSGSTIRLYAQWIKRDGISGTETLSNGAVVSNEDHFGKETITDVDFTIPYTVTEDLAADYSVSTDSADFAWSETGSVGHFYYMNDIVSPDSEIYVPGTLTLLLGNRAYDNYGQYYDVQITVSDIVLNPQRLGEYNSYDAGSISIFGYDTATGLVTASVMCSRITGASYDISVHILEHGTDTEVTGQRTVLYFQDLDSEDTSSLPAQYRYVYNSDGIAPYTEAVSVPSETSMEFYTKSGDNFVIAREENGEVRITGGEHTGKESAIYGQITTDGGLYYNDIPMTAQEYTAILFPVTSGAINISWSGSNCGTSLFASPAYGDLQILKVSAQPSATDDNAGYDLSGAVFGVYDEETSALDAAGNGAENGTEIMTLTTDSSGYTEVSGQLTRGTYYVAELNAPAGYKRSTEVKSVSAGAQTETVIFADEPMMDTAGLLLQKVDENGEDVAEEYAANFSGAQFLLEFYKESFTDGSSLENRIPDRSWVYAVKDTGAADLSDETGKISGDDLFYDSDSGLPALPAGTVVITELTAPSGFEKNGEVFILNLKIGADGSLSRGFYDAAGNPLDSDMIILENSCEAGLRISEPLTPVQLEIVKEILREDLLEEHGEVSFAFEVSGTDLTGKHHVFHQLLSFAGEPEGEGTAEKTAVIVIPAGTYTVTELETDRYVLTDIEALTDNLEAETENTGEKIGEIQPVEGYACGTLTEDGSILFRNRKADWSGFTHTTSAVNYIGGAETA